MSPTIELVLMKTNLGFKYPKSGLEVPNPKVHYFTVGLAQPLSPPLPQILLVFLQLYEYQQSHQQ